jgi:diguanylate cyclase (GGDEF)-like protein
MNKALILCIDDDQNILDALQRDLRQDFEVVMAQSFEEAQKIFSQNISIVICDYNLPQNTGLEILKWVKETHPGVLRVLLTGEVGLSDISSAMESNLIHKFILKPWEPALLRLHMQEAISTLRLLNERDKFKKLSITDPVTELTNHRFFQEKLRIEITKAKQTKTAVSLIMIDVDHFKILNDQFGHPRGDQILSLLAQKLTSEMLPNYSLSRYGGEEFAVILPRTPATFAYAFAETLRKSVGLITSLQFRLSISLGVASYPEHGLDADELVAVADQALYIAKKRGRNMTVLGQDSSD